MRTLIASELNEAVIAVLFFCSAVTGAADCNTLSITNQPQNQLVPEGCPITFVVGVAGSGPYAYQWWRNGQAVPDGTNSSYTIPLVRLSDNGTEVRVTISNGCSQITSDVAVVTLTLDVTPPVIRRARGDETLERVIVTFSAGACGWPGLDRVTAETPSNYSITGGIIVSNAVLDAGTNVILSTSRQTPGTVYTVSAKGVADGHIPANHVSPPNDKTEFQAWVMLAGSDPLRIVPPPIVMALSDGTISIDRPVGSFLEEAERITGPWGEVSEAGHPYRTSGTNGTRFFRAVFSP